MNDDNEIMIVHTDRKDIISSHHIVDHEWQNCLKIGTDKKPKLKVKMHCACAKY